MMAQILGQNCPRISVGMGNRMGRVKLRIHITRVFRNCRNCPRRCATRAISAISENTSDINP